MSEHDHNTGAAEVIAVAQRAVELRELDLEKDYAVVTPGGNAVLIDTEKLRERPLRSRGVFEPATVDSLIAYVEKHQDADHSTVWVHPTEGKVVAVLDDHAKDSPAWREHRAELTLIETEEWTLWTKGDGEYFDQETFAERLQDGLPDIAEPDAADLLEIASTLQGTTEAKFRSGVKLANGAVTMEYDEKIEATAGQHGDLAIPEVFKLAIAPFVGSEKVEVTARLRWRIRAGTVALGYKLEQPERIVRDALDGIAARLSDRFKDRVFSGTPAK